MEMTYPLLIYIGVTVLAIAFVLTFINFHSYKGGKKVVDSDIIKEIPHYKSLMIQYWVFRILMIASLMGAIIFAIFLGTKPTEVRTNTIETHNRDIFICFDVSTSLDGVNIEMCEQLKEFVKKLKGERFGISIFNAKSIQIVPLTSDYDYVISMIDVLEESIIAGKGVEYYYQVDDFNKYGYRFSGTLSEYGSSMIGDGLATCLYDFTDLETNPDRSRLIVFVTDNDVQGECIVDIVDACALCKKNDVKVFALAPDFVVDESTFKKAIKSTDGGYYNTRDKDAMKKMLEEVKTTDVTSTYRTEITAVDVPEKAFFYLLICMSVYFICARRIRL